MKPLHAAILASVMFAAVTIPALQARAADGDDQTPFEQGRAAGQPCVKDPTTCKVNNPPYPYKEPADDPANAAANEATANDNANYIAGFLIGKSEATK